jgi:uncharacterized protein YhbP (UPF0306 family)
LAENHCRGPANCSFQFAALETTSANLKVSSLAERMARAKAKRSEVSPLAASVELQRRILAYLEAHTTMTIASCQHDVPWAAAVFYANDGFDLYFLSTHRSRHGVNMAVNHLVSVAIYGDYRDWRAIRGIQLEGWAERLRSPKIHGHGWRIYRKKFSFVDEFFSPGALREMIHTKLAGIRLYRIVPRAIWYLDNSRGFGYRELLPFTSRGPIQRSARGT